jgi:ABC-type transport system substrate-binding protein
MLQAAAAAPFAGAGPLLAATPDSVTIGWPSDVTSWDPNQRFTPDAHSIMKAVFDQPLDQDARLKLSPGLITRWEMAADARSLTLDFRDDVLFHDGSKMTAADFRWTFFERIKAGHKVDIAQSMRKVTDIEVVSPTRAIMRFDSPAPTVPVWLAFLGSFLVPKAYMEKVGPEEFARKPVGTGPYKLVEHQMNARIVLCGMIEAYSMDKPPPGPSLGPVVGARATMKGLVVYDHMDRMDEMTRVIGGWMKKGSFHYREDITPTLAQAPEAFCVLMRGKNFGKSLVRVGPEQL